MDLICLVALILEAMALRSPPPAPVATSEAPRRAETPCESHSTAGSSRPWGPELDLEEYVADRLNSAWDCEFCDAFALPTPDRREAWRDAGRCIGQAPAAGLLLPPPLPGTRALQLIDRPTGHRYLVFEDSPPAGHGLQIFDATPQTELIVHIPHALDEAMVGREFGVHLLRETSARALLISTSDRRASPAPSPCDAAEPARHQASDAAHSPLTRAHALLAGLLEVRPRGILLELHGNAHPDCPGIFVSDGAIQPGPISPVLSIRDALQRATPFPVYSADNDQACPYLGQDSALGRLANRAPAPCAGPPPAVSSGRFLQIEMDRASRSAGPRPLARALREVFRLPRMPRVETMKAAAAPIHVSPPRSPMAAEPRRTSAGNRPRGESGVQKRQVTKDQ